MIPQNALSRRRSIANMSSVMAAISIATTRGGRRLLSARSKSTKADGINAQPYGSVGERKEEI